MGGVYRLTRRWSRLGPMLIFITLDVMRISVTAILVLVLGLSSCGPEPKDAYSKVANTKVELLPGFQSYESISALSRQLDVQASRAKVTEDSKLPPSDRRPRFDIYTIEVPDRAFCGQKGTLRLLFLYLFTALVGIGE
jgi:hypothetical protein